MEMDTSGDWPEEPLRLAGLPPAWDEFNQLSSPPAPSPSPARTASSARRSRRRLSGIQPCSSHRMTLRRRSGVAPLSPVERSLGALQLGDGGPEERPSSTSPAPAAVDVPPLSPPPPPPPPPPQPGTAEKPARRPARRRSLVLLNAPPPAPAAETTRKSRRRSFGGRSAADRDLADAVPEPSDGVDKENGWLGDGERPSSPVQSGQDRGRSASETDLLREVAEWRRGASAGSRAAGPEGDTADGCGSVAARDTAQDAASADEPAASQQPRRPAAASRRQRRRSAGGALFPAAELPAPPDSAAAGAETETMESAAAVTSVASDTAATDTAAGPSAPTPAAGTSVQSATGLPAELVMYYLNQNYQPPAESRLPTIAEEVAEPAAPARPARTARRRCAADLGVVRKCAMELTPAKQRLRKLKAQRLNGKARSRKGRPTTLKLSKQLDARLNELDLFHKEQEARERAEQEARERAEQEARELAEREGRERQTAAVPDCAGSAENEPMDVESAPAPLPSPPLAGSAARSPGSDCGQSPLLGRPPRSPAPLGPLPLVVPDLDATWTRSPALGDVDLDGSVLSRAGSELVLELTRSSVDSTLSDGRSPDGPPPPVRRAAASPVIVGGGELNLAALRRADRLSDGEEAPSPCVGGRLDRAVLLSPGDST
ncbi:MAP7 domain-containing protein 1-like [Amphibalanus amphitrite]|uniref:MAP7 domain-containing protein 1-like n=1 Tax=Amphibalanus amphitrite TaxID=1232801 RepID=UPI001C903F57|nr:MAP7 domain-containing protein 1-like [Amphibalanus amphitrite]XP_043216243.1 MAP7 domain-containing protein 1-like [Amphibalanus amphitrite]